MGTDANLRNGLTGLAAAGGDLARFLKGVQFRLKAFDGSGADGESSLGFEYGFEKNLTSTRGDGKRSWSADVYGYGDVAFDADVNPDDFLRTGIRFHTRGYSSDTPTLDAVSSEELSAAIAREALLSGDEADRAWQEVENILQENFYARSSYQAFWDAGVNVALESNQDFSRRQTTYGLEAGAIVRSPNSEASLSRMNVFDYPTALVRLLTGADESFSPQGLYVPALLVGVDLVDPKDDDVRAALDDDPFPRVRFELESRPVVGQMDGRDVYLALDWRFYQEIDAPSSVRDAELDQYSLFQAAIELPSGWSLSYAAGRLPLDVKDGSQFALGFQMSF